MRPQFIDEKSKGQDHWNQGKSKYADQSANAVLVDVELSCQWHFDASQQCVAHPRHEQCGDLHQSEHLVHGDLLRMNSWSAAMHRRFGFLRLLSQPKHGRIRNQGMKGM